MNANQQLVRQRTGAIEISKTPLKPQELCLLGELALTAENSKTEIGPELQAEFLRVFANESPLLLKRAFQSWRMKSNFTPSIREIYQLIEEEAADFQLERDEEREKAERADARGALRQWEDPAQKVEHQKLIEDLGKRLTASRMKGLANPRARMDNIVARSQARALADLPPKKSPKPLPAEAGEAPKRIEKVAGPIARQK